MTNDELKWYLEYGIDNISGTLVNISDKYKLFLADGYRFYILHNECGHIGIILDMDSVDLHLYLDENFRGQGLVTEAIKNFVIPFGKILGKKNQRVTFYDEKVKKIFENCGFEEIDNFKMEYIYE